MWDTFSIYFVVFGATYLIVNFVIYCLSFLLTVKTRKKLAIKPLNVPALVAVITGFIIYYLSGYLSVL